MIMSEITVSTTSNEKDYDIGSLATKNSGSAVVQQDMNSDLDINRNGTLAAAEKSSIENRVYGQGKAGFLFSACHWVMHRCQKSRFSKAVYGCGRDKK